jgi:hypothetical protein
MGLPSIEDLAGRRRKNVSGACTPLKHVTRFGRTSDKFEFSVNAKPVAEER